MRGKWRKLCTGERQIVFDDERYLFVQNSFLNLEGMSNGSITVIDLKTDQVVGNIDTLKTAGFNPNCIMPLPNHFQKGGLRASAQLISYELAMGMSQYVLRRMGTETAP